MMFDFAKKVIYILKTHGFRGVKQAVDASCGKTDVISFYGWIADETKIPLNEEQKNTPREKITLNWVIPDIGVGSGGHMNIFRFISHLERLGLHSRIYLYQSARFSSDQDFRGFLKEHYSSTLNAPEVEAFYNVDSMTYADATIATGWQTAYYVRRFENTKEKFYFVQDFEPCFYPLGSEYIFAENTYKFGFKGITAGDWLKNKLHNEYGMETESFGFSYDKDIYVPEKKKDDVERIFFYARPVTPRRAFELGLIALNEIYKKRPDIEVVFAGWDISNYEIPFKHENLGTAKIEDLSKVYANCSLCFVMSTSNLSLLPLEVMASNAVVATSYGDNNEWLLNSENSILFNNDPVEIANTIIHYLDNPQLIEEKRVKGMEFAKSTDWEKEAKKVYDFIVKCVGE
ncbi:MAG: glycosyltransferase family 4 protein [Clostridiales bacterium]|nr:glycosyltransferase family 4 protein [Clostridiales bacterium]